MIQLLVIIYCFGAQVYSYNLQSIGNSTNISNTSITNNTNILTSETKLPLTYMLPTDVLPVNYKLSITPYFEENSEKNFTFDGTVEIELKVKNAAKSIILHSENLQFTRENCTLKKTDNRDVENFSVNFDTIKNFVIFSMINDELLSRGKYALRINYVGKIIHDNAIGLFAKFYSNEKGQKVWYLTSYLQPSYARSVLPCFDEPNYKSTFDIAITHDRKYRALSNMPVKDVSYQNSTATTIFKTSPPMATYLLAFFISDFESVSNDAKDFTLYSTSNFIKRGDFGLVLGEKVLKELEQFTNVSYEIGKLDLIGLPFRWDMATENLGLLTYGENMFFYREKEDTTFRKLLVSMNVAHELSHHWFGNIATPRGWKYLWLSESITSFISNYILEKVEPTLGMMDVFFIFEVQAALDKDSDQSALPIVRDAESPDEIRSIFDYSGVYGKGAAIVCMMQHILTESVFQKSLENYLNVTYYKNADSEDFFQAVQEVINKENISLQVNATMDSWLNFKGYPIVNVIRNYKAKTIEIKQERFITSRVDEEEVKDKWHIPINYASTTKLDFNKTTPEYWLTNSSMTIDVDVDSDHWIILNKQQTGFYRVNYDDSNWRRIIDYLSSPNRENIHVRNRAQLMYDALTFAQQEKLSIETLLRLTKYLRSETDCVAWYPALGVFKWFKDKLIGTRHYSSFKEYVLKTIKHMHDTIISFEETTEDKDFTRLCRIEIITTACNFGGLSCHRNMHGKFLKWLGNPQKNIISPNVKSITLCYGMRVANFSTLDASLQKKFNDLFNTTEKGALIASLGCSSDEEYLKSYLNDAVDKKMNSEDIFTILMTMLDYDSVKIDLVLAFLVEKLPASYVHHDDEVLASIIKKVASKLTTPIQQEKLKTSKYATIFPHEIDEGLRIAKDNVEWLEKNSKIISNIISELYVNYL